MGEDFTDERSGISRRSLIKKSAIVGGTVVWAAPVVQSITSKALAQDVGSNGIGEDISHFTLVITQLPAAVAAPKKTSSTINPPPATPTWWAKYEGAGSACDEGLNNGSCQPDTGANQAGCPPVESHSVAQAPNGNDIIVTVNAGWSVIDFNVKDAQFCLGPGETGGSPSVTQPGVPQVGPVSFTLFDPKAT